MGLLTNLFSSPDQKKEPDKKKTIGLVSGPASLSILKSFFPPEFHDRFNEPVGGKELQEILTEVYQKYPERYADIVNNLIDFSKEVIYQYPVYSVKPEDFILPPKYKELLNKLEAEQNRLYMVYKNNSKKLEEELSKLGTEAIKKLSEEIPKDPELQKNALVMQVKSKARGNPIQLMGLLTGDILYTDHKLDIIPILITRGFIHGLYPHQIWAGSYGGRYGLYYNAFGTKVSGALNKQIIQATHRMCVVTQQDSPLFYKYKLGYPVSTDSGDIVGALLAQPVDRFPQNTLITPAVLAYLQQKGIKKILIRSPVASITKDGELAAYDLGIRERGTLPAVGEFVGITASQAISEPLTQAQLSAKHLGGIKASRRATDILNNLVAFFSPSESSGIMATHSEDDGVVEDIIPSEFGGKKIIIKRKDGSKVAYYVDEDDDDITVKKGGAVEAGDMLVSGIPDLSRLVEHKGIGEARRLFVKYLKDILADGGINANSRNLEILASGIINSVMLTDRFQNFYPGDIVSYSKVAYYWKPRRNSRVMKITSTEAVGKYLEEPVLHYTIGTKIKPSMLEELKEFGIKEITVHDQPPPFAPVYVRLMDQLEKDEDWMVRQLGQHLQKGLLDAARRGLVSSYSYNTSFVPALARGPEFGYVPYTQGPTRQTIEEARRQTEELRKRSKI